MYLWAGIGDTIAKYYEVVFSMRGDSPSYGPVLGQAISCMCNRPLIGCALEACEDCKNNRVSDALTHAALNIVVSTGLVSGLVGVITIRRSPMRCSAASLTIPSIERDHCHRRVSFLWRPGPARDG